MLTNTGLVGCTLIESVSKHPSTNVFRSEDFIVYQLQAATPSTDLAERFLGDRKKSWLIEESNPDVNFQGGDSIVIPLNSTNPGGLRIDGVQTVPILTYHRFSAWTSEKISSDYHGRWLSVRVYIRVSHSKKIWLHSHPVRLHGFCRRIQNGRHLGPIERDEGGRLLDRFPHHVS